MDTFGLKIIASDGVFYEGRCKKLIIPASDGEKGAQEQKERAEERLRQQQSIQQYYHTQASLARAMNRLRVSQDKKWNL